jgi:hypothetical protein
VSDNLSRKNSEKVSCGQAEITHDQLENRVAFPGPVTQTEGHGFTVLQTSRKVAQPRFAGTTTNRTIFRRFAIQGHESNVELLHSIGCNVLDKWATQCAAKWRFRPNSVVQARVAIQLFKTRY